MTESALSFNRSRSFFDEKKREFIQHVFSLPEMRLLLVAFFFLVVPATVNAQFYLPQEGWTKIEQEAAGNCFGYFAQSINDNEYPIQAGFTIRDPETRDVLGEDSINLPPGYSSHHGVICPPNRLTLPDRFDVDILLENQNGATKTGSLRNLRPDYTPEAYIQEQVMERVNATLTAIENTRKTIITRLQTSQR